MMRLLILLGTENEALLRAISRQRPGFSDPSADSRTWPIAVRFPEIVDGLPTHPSTHAALADRCILGITEEGRRIILCTHSVAFVRRIRRRVAFGAMAPADVGLIWVEPDEAEKAIRLDDNGLPSWWPEVDCA